MGTFHVKRTLALIALVSGITLSTVAQTLPVAVAAPAAPARIAVIAFQEAVARTNEGQRDFADLQKKFAPKREQLRVVNNEIDELTKKLQAQTDKLSVAERVSQARRLEEKKKQLQRDAEDAKNDYKTEMQKTYNNLASKVYDVLVNYAQQQGYTLVLDAAQQQNPVLFANESTNITKPIIEAYNVKSGVPAPPMQPATSHPVDQPSH
jgi:outer membrane protein